MGWCFCETCLQGARLSPGGDSQQAERGDEPTNGHCLLTARADTHCWNLRSELRADARDSLAFRIRVVLGVDRTLDRWPARLLQAEGVALSPAAKMPLAFDSALR